MYKLSHKTTLREKRKLRLRGKISGTAVRPRLSVFRSLKYTYAQLVDDKSGKTLVDVSDAVKKLGISKSKSEAAYEVGKELAARAKRAKIKEVVFDRDGYKFHGRVKRLAEGAREGGLVF